MELNEYKSSAAFTADEKLVLAYADGMTSTPVEVGDAVFAGIKALFSPAQIVELTSMIAWENYRARFNHALHIEAQGFAEGAYCALPERR